jgi:uncharacterized protein YdcH (DUF465 family)
MERAMSKRSGFPPYRRRRSGPAPESSAGIAPGDAIATVLVDIQVQLTRIDGRLDRMDDRFDHMDQRFDHMDQRFDRIDVRFDKMDDRIERVEVSVKELAKDVHALTFWKERLFGVVLTCGFIAALLAVAVNITKLLGLNQP